MEMQKESPKEEKLQENTRQDKKEEDIFIIIE
jgi:hypothetical protein